MNIFTEMHTLELSWLTELQKFRTPFFDYFFKAITQLDEQPILFFLGIALIYGVNRRFGLWFLFFFMINSFVNIFLKQFFEEPRPCWLLPDLQVFSCPSNYGFPSGAGQTSVLVPGMIIAYHNTRRNWILAVLLGALLSFSRLYLGVHFFSDIVGGWIVGTLVLGAAIFVRPFDFNFSKFQMRILAALIIAFSFISVNPIFVTECFLISGMVYGLSIGEKATSPTYLKGIAAFILSNLLGFYFLHLIRTYFNDELFVKSMFYFIFGFMIIALLPKILNINLCRSIGKKQTKVL